MRPPVDFDPRPVGLAICASSSAKDAAPRHIREHPCRSSSSPRHASPSTLGQHGRAHPCPPKSAAEPAFSAASLALPGASDGAIPPDIPHAYEPPRCPRSTSAIDRACPSSGDAHGNIRSASYRCAATPRREPPTRIAAPCSRNVSNSTEILHATKEPDMSRECTTQSGCRDRTLTTAGNNRGRAR